MSYKYEYPRAALTVDCVVFGLDDEDLKVLLIQRDLEPFAGKWGLPGGFAEMEESLEHAAGPHRVQRRSDGRGRSARGGNLLRGVEPRDATDAGVARAHGCKGRVHIATQRGGHAPAGDDDKLGGGPRTALLRRRRDAALARCHGARALLVYRMHWHLGRNPCSR